MKSIQVRKLTYAALFLALAMLMPFVAGRIPDIGKRLCEYGSGDLTVHIAARLAYPDERIISGKANEFTNTECDGLCAVITENKSPESCARFGIPDTEFERGNVPMTKSEIRAVLASKLKVCYNDTVWDIGCGTGSVSVECALAANDGTVFAVDKNDEAVSLTNKNAHNIIMIITIIYNFICRRTTLPFSCIYFGIHLIMFIIKLNYL